MALAGISRTTTEPAPMMLFSPIRTPLQTMALSPIQKLFPMLDRCGIPDSQAAVVDAMPVRIGDKHALGQHAALSDDDLRGGADPHPGTDQGATTDLYLASPFQIRPDGQTDLAVGCGDHRGMIPQRHRPPEDLHMPGLHEVASLSQMLKLRPEKAVCIPHLKFQVETLEEIGSMVFSQG